MLTTNTSSPYAWLLLFSGHSGSSAFIDQLARHPLINVTGFEPVDGASQMTDNEALMYTDAAFSLALRQNREGFRVVSGFKLRVHRPQRNITGWANLIVRHRVQLLVLVQANVLKDALTTTFNQKVFCEVMCLSQGLGGQTSDGAEIATTSLTGAPAKIHELKSLCRRHLPSQCVNVYGSVLQFFWQYTNVSREAIERVAPVSLSVAETIQVAQKTAVSN